MDRILTPPRDVQHLASGVLSPPLNAKSKPPTIEVLIPSTDLQSRTYIKGFNSSEGVNRTFCGGCGTHFSFHWTASYADDEDEKETLRLWEPYFDMAIGTFDREILEMEGMRPSRQSWWNDGIQWVKDMIRE